MPVFQVLGILLNDTNTQLKYNMSSKEITNGVHHNIDTEQWVIDALHQVTKAHNIRQVQEKESSNGLNTSAPPIEQILHFLEQTSPEHVNDFINEIVRQANKWFYHRLDELKDWDESSYSAYDVLEEQNSTAQSLDHGLSMISSLSDESDHDWQDYVSDLELFEQLPATNLPFDEKTTQEFGFQNSPSGLNQISQPQFLWIDHRKLLTKQMECLDKFNQQISNIHHINDHTPDLLHRLQAYILSYREALKFMYWHRFDYKPRGLEQLQNDLTQVQNNLQDDYLELFNAQYRLNLQNAVQDHDLAQQISQVKNLRDIFAMMGALTETSHSSGKQLSHENNTPHTSRSKLLSQMSYTSNPYYNAIENPGRSSHTGKYITGFISASILLAGVVTLFTPHCIMAGTLIITGATFLAVLGLFAQGQQPLNNNQAISSTYNNISISTRLSESSTLFEHSHYQTSHGHCLSEDQSFTASYDSDTKSWCYISS